MALCGHCGRDARISAPVSEFCAISGLRPSSVWKLLAAGELKSVCVGRRRLVLLASFHDFIERQRAGSPLDARRNATVLPLGTTRPANPLNVRIEALGLSPRAHNALHAEGIDSVGDLIERRGRDLLQIPNFGRRCLGEVEAALAQLHLQLRRREPAAAE